MKILFLTNVPSPYRVDFFNELGKSCDLTVLFECTGSTERDKSWQNYRTDRFQAVFLRGIKMGVAEALCPQVIKYLLPKIYDRIVVTNFCDPTGMMAVSWLKTRGIPYCVESDGGFPGSGHGFKENAKRWILSGAELAFSTAEVHDLYYLKYGIPRQRIVRYPFTSLKASNLIKQVPSREEKQECRTKLGMCEPNIILAVGQFIPRKGFDILLQALSRMGEDVGCYIVGGEPTEEYIQIVENLHLNHVHFVGFQVKEELNKYYLAADIFVHPTRKDIWGLVINEAMAKALPVVTTVRCIAGQQLIKDGLNGRLIPDEDPEKLAEAVTECLQKKDRMSEEALNTISGYTVENMADVHMRVLEHDK